MRSGRGFSVIEVLFAAAVLCTAAALSVPLVTGMADDFRTAGAVRYVSGRLARARMEAVMRAASTAVRFDSDKGHEFGVFVDGNGNGVLARDIDRGIDRELHGTERLSDRFTGVNFGLLPDLPPVEGSSAPGDDPVRVGAGDMLVFTPLGTATPGSLYIRGPGERQFVIRVFGDTGRLRILRFEPGTRRWTTV